jgi:hypothetical protein
MSEGEQQWPHSSTNSCTIDPRCRANRCCKNRKQNFRIILHRALILVAPFPMRLEDHVSYMRTGIRSERLGMWRCQKKRLRFELRMHRKSAAFRLLVIVISLAAWFVASNHCALATPFEVAKLTVSSQCPMHAHKQQMPQRNKGNGCGDLPCCKNLQAPLAATAKTIAKPMWLGVLRPFFPEVVGAFGIQPRTISLVLETGPPGALSFSETVLQRSILAHAPPLILS